MWWFHAGNKETPWRCTSGKTVLQQHMAPGGTFVSAMINVPSDVVPGDVLIVEDDPIIALDFEDTILRLGVKTVRTAGGVTRALRLIEERAPDFALLDIGLVRENSFAVAERLESLGIPFAFVTGYGVDAAMAAVFAQTPRLPKPCSVDALRAVLKDAAPGGGAR